MSIHSRIDRAVDRHRRATGKTPVGIVASPQLVREIYVEMKEPGWVDSFLVCGEQVAEVDQVPLFMDPELPYSQSFFLMSEDALKRWEEQRDSTE